MIWRDLLVALIGCLAIWIAFEALVYLGLAALK
jgi:hypothetical protein